MSEAKKEGVTIKAAPGIYADILQYIKRLFVQLKYSGIRITCLRTGRTMSYQEFLEECKQRAEAKEKRKNRCRYKYPRKRRKDGAPFRRLG